MDKTFHIALKEFLSTVTTKGFIIGALAAPLLITGMLVLMPLLMDKDGPRVSGRVAVIDLTGQGGEGPVVRGIRERFDPAAVAAEREEIARRTTELIEGKMGEMGVDASRMGGAGGVGAIAAQSAAAAAPDLTLEVLPPDADVEAEKSELLRAEVVARGAAEESASRLALAVIPPEAVEPDPQGKFGGFELYVMPKLDFQVQDRISRQIGQAIVDARIEASGLGLDKDRLRALVAPPRAEARAVTAAGERRTSDAAGVLVPLGFMFLLWVSVFTAGQYLLTTTIEEKGSRVMEVLLSAVSPMQLMVGKILGQMGVGLVILIVYSSLGIGALRVFQLVHLLDPASLAYVIIFFLIAFFLIAAMMAAIGSAVTDLREAQSLMTPVMIVLFIPMMLWMPIQRTPNSTFAQVLSFVPPVSPFVMVLRVSGSEPIPAWQIPASIAVGVLSAVGAAWAAAKIFRVGVLMYGKPPNFATLVRWIRMA